jgi:hypothetical protein
MKYLILSLLLIVTTLAEASVNEVPKSGQKPVKITNKQAGKKATKRLVAKKLVTKKTQLKKAPVKKARLRKDHTRGAVAKKAVTHAPPLSLASQKVNSKAGYELAIQVEERGAPFANPKIKVKQGKVASITTRDAKEVRTVEVEASQYSDQFILMKFVLSKIDQSGKKIVLGRPQILAKENQNAKVEIATDQSKTPDLSLAVTAKKINF